MKLRSKTGLLALTTAATAFLACLTVTGASASDESAGSNVKKSSTLSEVDRIMNAQVPLDAAAEEIETTLEGQKSSGFTSIRVSAKKNALTMRWKGGVPAAREKAIQAARGRGIDVQVLPAKYSLAELQAQIDALIASERETVKAADRPHTYSPLEDGSGIEVSVTKRDASLEPLASKDSG